MSRRITLRRRQSPAQRARKSLLRGIEKMIAAAWMTRTLWRLRRSA
jgi:hypothetical protein